MADDLRPPSLEELARWPIAMANELLALPGLLRDARHLVRDMARVTDQFATTAEVLGGLLERFVGLTDDLEARIVQVSVPLDSIERSTTELRNAAFGLLRRVPGARRVADEADEGEA
jgi:hypothetical protein